MTKAVASSKDRTLVVSVVALSPAEEWRMTVLTRHLPPDTNLEELVNTLGFQVDRQIGRSFSEKTFRKAWDSDRPLYAALYKAAMFNAVEQSVRQFSSIGKRTVDRKRAIPQRIRMQVLDHYGPRCQICKKEFPKKSNGEPSFEAHHIYPERLGGRVSMRNLIPLCHSCNKGLWQQFGNDSA